VLIASLLTAQLYLNWTPTLASSAEATPTATPVPVASGQTPTPAPTGTIATTPEISVPGMLVYAKSGVLWIQSGNGGSPAHPVGERLTAVSAGLFAGRPVDLLHRHPGHDRAVVRQRGVLRRLLLNYPVLCRIHPDGTGRKDVLSSLIRKGSGRIFFWILEPSISRSGLTAAVASDGPTVRPFRTC